MTPEELMELTGMSQRDYPEILGALSRHESLRPEEVYLYARRCAREALEDAARIADHHVDVHDTAVKTFEAVVPQDSDSKLLADAHRAAVRCAARIADDIREVKEGR